MRSIKVRIQKQTVKKHDNANYMSKIFRAFVINVIPFFRLCKTVFWILNSLKKNRTQVNVWSKELVTSSDDQGFP